MGKKVFVTVGTTKFDKLIRTVTSDEVLEALNDKGYDQLILQIGRSECTVNTKLRCGFQKIEKFQLQPSIRQYMEAADLIISHAGAGSCLEALEAGKPLIVVTNDLLMDNHQLELAQQLFKDGHLLYCNCEELLTIVKTMEVDKLVKFFDDRSEKIARTIDKLMGFD